MVADPEVICTARPMVELAAMGTFADIETNPEDTPEHVARPYLGDVPNVLMKNHAWNCCPAVAPNPVTSSAYIPEADTVHCDVGALYVMVVPDEVGVPPVNPVNLAAVVVADMVPVVP